MWDAGVIWALNTSETSIQCFRISGMGRDLKGQAIEPLCSISLFQQHECPSPVDATCIKTAGDAILHYCDVRIIPLSWQSNSEGFVPPLGPKESFKLRPPPADVHMLTVVIGTRLLAFKV